MASFSRVVSFAECNVADKSEVETSNQDSHCDHSCCKRSGSSTDSDDNEKINQQSNKGEDLSANQNKPSNEEKDGCNCNKKTSSQSLFLSPNQEVIVYRSKIIFKNKFTNPKTYHFDLNYSIFHPPRVLA